MCKGKTLPIYSHRNQETLKKFYTSNESLIVWGSTSQIFQSTSLSSKNLSRRELELRTSDVLASTILDKEVKIERDANGRPYINGSSENISISHTRSTLGVIINPHTPVALDIEITNRNVGPVKQKFTTSDEIELVRKVHTDNPEILIWSCKECLFKILPFAAIHFKDQLTFNEAAQPNNNNDFATIWSVNHPNFKGGFLVNSFIFDDLLISYIDTKPL